MTCHIEPYAQYSTLLTHRSHEGDAAVLVQRVVVAVPDRDRDRVQPDRVVELVAPERLVGFHLQLGGFCLGFARNLALYDRSSTV
jgi:hypothetical protein